MSKLKLWVLATAAWLVVGCSESIQASPDAPIVVPLDAPAGTVTLPVWQLEDVQPASPRVGQTYGVDTFSGKIVVVCLLEGF